MSDHTRSLRLQAAADDVFDFLGRVDRLPSYIADMTKAEPGDEPGEVRVAAQVQGRTVEGTARLEIDDDARRISWSSEGDNDYHGWLAVRGDDTASEVEIHISTSRPADEGEIDRGLDETLDRVRSLVEQRVAR
jgi:hypothetical protein